MPTSSPRTTSAPARAPSRRPSRRGRDDFEVVLRVEGVPVHRDLPAALGGGHRLRRRRRAASSRSRSRPASTRRGSTCTATPRAGPSSREALEAGVGDVVVDNHTDIDLLERARARRRARSACAAHRARRQPRHAPGDLDRRPEHEVRLRPRARAGGDRARSRRRRRSTSQGLHFHIGSQILELGPFRDGAARRWRGSATFPAWSTSAAASASPTSSAEQPPSIEDYVEAKVDAVARGPRARDADPRRAGPRARRQLDCVTLYEVQSDQAQRRHLRRGRRRHVRQPAPDALRRALRGPGRRRARAAARAATSSASTASRATSSSATRELADPRSGDVARRRRRPAPTATRWPTTTTASRAPPVVFVAGRGRAARRPPGHLRGSDRAGRRVTDALRASSASACSATAPSAPPSPRSLDERADEVERLTGLPARGSAAC